MGELSCIDQACMPESTFSSAGLDRPIFSDPYEEVLTRSFYSLRPGSYNETRGSIGGPEVVETLYNI
jgi:hypothetical protein